jgi:hypothetical protein
VGTGGGLSRSEGAGVVAAGHPSSTKDKTSVLACSKVRSLSRYVFTVY